MGRIKIVIVTRSVVDSTLPLRCDASTPHLAQASWVLNPFDEVAMEAAVQLRSAWRAFATQTLGADSEQTAQAQCELLVVGYADAPGVQAAERALSLGGDRAILLEALRPSSTPSARHTRTLVDELAVLIGQEQPDLLLIGKMAY